MQDQIDIEREVCPFCLENDLKRSSVTRDRWRYGMYTMAHCNTCHSETAWPRVPASESSYDHDMPADRWEFFKVVGDIKGSKTVGELLDVGSGKGAFVSLATAHSIPAIGIDYNQQNIDYANGVGARCYKMDIGDFSADRKFSVITAFHVLEHVPNPLELLNAFSEHLVESGSLYLSFPNINRANVRFKRDIGDYPPNHLSRISNEGIRYLAKSARFDVVNSWTEPRDMVWREATSLKINAVMEALGWSQFDNHGDVKLRVIKFCLALFLQPAIIWNLLVGRSEPGYSVLYKLARTYEIREDEEL